MSEEESEFSEGHTVFATEVIECLLTYAGLKESEAACRNYIYCTPDIVEAIFFIGRIFKADFEKIISHVRYSLKDVELFKECCKLIPATKDNGYFYYYLKRIALIFKMAMFCYENCKKNDFKYFDLARLCIGSCPDMQYFESAGGWDNLKDTASFLMSIAGPHNLITLHYGEENDKTLVDAVEELRLRFVHGGAVKMLDSNEMKCLLELKECIKNKLSKATSSKNSRRTQSCNVDFEEFLESGWKILSDYFIDQMLRALGVEKHRTLSTDEPIDKILLEIGYNDVVNFKSRESSERNGFHDDAPLESAKSSDNALEDCGIEKHRTLPTDEPIDKILSEIGDNDVVNFKSRECSERNGVQDNAPLESAKSSDNALEDCGDGYFSEVLPISHAASCSPVTSTEEESQALHSSFSDTCTELRKSKRTPKDRPSSRSGKSKTSKSSSLENSENSEEEAKSDASLNFVVPQEYMACVRNMHKRKHLYFAKMDPPSNREMLDESLKSVIDARISCKNYKQLANGDIFVCSPDSTHEGKTAMVFVDSSSDEDIEEDTYRLVCLFKKVDMQYEDKSSNLRSRKHGNKTSTPNKTKRKGVKCESPESTIISASRSPNSTKYLTSLYKSYFAVLFKAMLETLKQIPKEAPPRKIKVRKPSNLMFIISASLLAKRRVDLVDSLKKTSLRCLVLFTFKTRELDMMEEKELNSCIEKKMYHPIDSDPSVYLVGSNYFDKADFFKVKFLALFPAITAPKFVSHPNRTELMQILNSYEKAVLSWADIPDKYYFNHVRRDFDGAILY